MRWEPGELDKFRDLEQWLDHTEPELAARLRSRHRRFLHVSPVVTFALILTVAPAVIVAGAITHNMPITLIGVVVLQFTPLAAVFCVRRPARRISELIHRRKEHHGTTR